MGKFVSSLKWIKITIKFILTEIFQLNKRKFLQSKSGLYCALKGQIIIKKGKGQGRIKIREEDNIKIIA